MPAPAPAPTPPAPEPPPVDELQLFSAKPVTEARPKKNDKPKTAKEALQQRALSKKQRKADKRNKGGRPRDVAPVHDRGAVAATSASASKGKQDESASSSKKVVAPNEDAPKANAPRAAAAAAASVAAAKRPKRIPARARAESTKADAAVEPEAREPTKPTGLWSRIKGIFGGK